MLNSESTPARHRPERRPTAIGAVLLLWALVACAPGPAPAPSGSSSAETAAPTDTQSPPTSLPIDIDSPVADAPVTIPVSVRGTAGAPDTALVVDLLDEDGQTLCVRNLTAAAAASGAGGAWHTDLAFSPPDAEQPVTLRAYELSAEDGSATNVSERPLTLTPERPPVIITSPACGASIAAGGVLEVRGRAMVPEGQFTVELRDSAGAPVLTEQVTAASGSEESDFSVTLPVPAGIAAGYYDLVGFDNSLKDGSVQYEFPVQLVLQ